MKLEPITKEPSVPEIIEATGINEKIQIHADRMQSFKTQVSRINKDKKTGRVLFSYSTITDNYYTATRIA